MLHKPRVDAFEREPETGKDGDIVGNGSTATDIGLLRNKEDDQGDLKTSQYYLAL